MELPLDRVAKELAKARGNEIPNIDACSQLVTVLMFEFYIAHSVFILFLRAGYCCLTLSTYIFIVQTTL